MDLRSCLERALVPAVILLISFVSSLSPVQADEVNQIALRGTFFDFIDDPWKHVGHEEEAARFYEDGMIVIENGIIKAYGPYEQVSSRFPQAKVTTISNRIIVPGFIDGHVHFPQTRVLGEYGKQLLPWLQEWIFPEETRYSDPAYAREGIKHYFDNLLASGTTTVLDYGTSFPSAIEAFFEEASRRNMRVICGLGGIDRNAPKDFVTPPEMFYSESKRLIEKYHGKGRNLYAITPRFALVASPELMTKCTQLHKEFPDCWVNTHLSENLTETSKAPLAHGCSDYLGCYEKYGLLGPKFVAGHGVWLSDDEFERLSKAGATISVCPVSNAFLGSGTFRLGRATDPKSRVRLAFGTDMGGGNRFSMINVLDQMYKSGMLNSTLIDGSCDPSKRDDDAAERNKLNPYRAFYSITLGSAQGLYLDDKLGNFNPGKEADFVVLDWNGGPPATVWHQSLICAKPATVKEAAQLLFGVFAVGDERAVDETWIFGNCVYKKAGKTSY